MSCCCEDNNFPPEPEGITVQDEGVALPGVFDTLNFAGGGIVATDAGGGVADITVVDTKQVFRYVATGMEANPFTVTLPAVRANANYNVQCTMGGPVANTLKSSRALVATFTNADFDVEVSAPVEADDVFMFTVEDLT